MLKPHRETQDGRHTSYFWDRLVVSKWVAGPLQVMRRRIYKDAANTVLREEAWTVSLKLNCSNLALRWRRSRDGDCS